MEASVTGVGWVTAAGIGRGREGSFSWGEGDLPLISRKDVFADSRPHFGRMDRFSKTGLAAISMALRDAGIESGKEQTIGVIASTARGCIDTDRLFFSAVSDRGAQFASPHLFVFVTGSTFLGEACIEFGLRGPTLLMSEEEPDRCAVLASAVEMISSNQSPVMAAGICDTSVGQADGASNKAHRPGALFFVLQRDAGRDQAYGAVNLHKEGLFFHGTPVNDITRFAVSLSRK